MKRQIGIWVGMFVGVVGLLTQNCGASPPPSDNIGFDEKADGWSPDFGFVMVFEKEIEAIFGVGEYAIYGLFPLYAESQITIKTKCFHRGTDEEIAENHSMDTVLYLYKKAESGMWGRYILKDDNSGYGKFSKIGPVTLSKGEYRIVVARKKEDVAASTTIITTCEGTGCIAPENPPVDCEPSDYWCLFRNGLPGGKPNPARTTPIAVGDLSAEQKQGIENAQRSVAMKSTESSPCRVLGMVFVLFSETDASRVGIGVFGGCYEQEVLTQPVVVGLDMTGAQMFECLGESCGDRLPVPDCEPTDLTCVFKKAFPNGKPVPDLCIAISEGTLTPDQQASVSVANATIESRTADKFVCRPAGTWFVLLNPEDQNPLGIAVAGGCFINDREVRLVVIGLDLSGGQVFECDGQTCIN